MSGNSEIIKRIDNLHKMRHLKREVAYEVAGIAHNSFSNWCRTEDAKIPAQALYLIAQFLNVSVEYLLTGKDSIPQSQARKLQINQKLNKIKNAEFGSDVILIKQNY